MSTSESERVELIHYLSSRLDRIENKVDALTEGSARLKGAVAFLVAMVPIMVGLAEWVKTFLL